LDSLGSTGLLGDPDDVDLIQCGAHWSALIDNEALQRLVCDVGDQLEVLVEVKDGQVGQLRRGGYQDVRNRRRSMVA